MSTHPATQHDQSSFRPRLQTRARIGVAFKLATLVATLVGVVVLAILLVDTIMDGGGQLSGDFLRHNPSYLASRSGLQPALLGTIWMMLITALVSFPLGVGTAIWLEEYAPDNRLRRIIQTNIANLAGVPSIVYGILGLAVFVRAFALGRSVLAGGLTLALLILPVIIIASQEAIKAVPSTIRLGAYALGATSLGNDSFSRAAAGPAGVLTGPFWPSRAPSARRPPCWIGALAFIDFTPRRLTDPFTAVLFRSTTGCQAAGGLPRAGGRGGHSCPGAAAGHERGRDLPAQPLLTDELRHGGIHHYPTRRDRAGNADLSVLYGEVRAVKHITIKIPDRKVVAFIGLSGCARARRCAASTA
jgi:phosphate transport system permease protein